MTTMSTKEAINFGLRKFSFNEIRDNQRKLVEAYAWMIAPTGFGKSLVFWSLESLFSLFTKSALPRSSLICSYDDKNCFLISRIFSNKIVVVSGSVSSNDISHTAFSVGFRAQKDFQIHARLRLDPAKKPSSVIWVWYIFPTEHRICFFRIWQGSNPINCFVEVTSSPSIVNVKYSRTCKSPKNCLL